MVGVVEHPLQRSDLCTNKMASFLPEALTGLHPGNPNADLSSAMTFDTLRKKERRKESKRKREKSSLLSFVS